MYRYTIHKWKGGMQSMPGGGSLLLRPIIFWCKNILHLYTAGEDYEHILRNVYIRPDYIPIAKVYIPILSDDVQEGDELFTLEVTAFDFSIVLVNNVVEVLIEDDDDGMNFKHH